MFLLSYYWCIATKNSSFPILPFSCTKSCRVLWNLEVAQCSKCHSPNIVMKLMTFLIFFFVFEELVHVQKQLFEEDPQLLVPTVTYVLNFEIKRGWDLMAIAVLFTKIRVFPVSALRSCNFFSWGPYSKCSPKAVVVPPIVFSEDFPQRVELFYSLKTAPTEAVDDRPDERHL